MRTCVFLAAAAVALGLSASPASAQKAPPAPIADMTVVELPKEAREALALIRKGGPYAYAKDGAEFRNREGKLPKQKRGYYREYTVKTPGERTRGARRLVTGKGGETYYTADHYNSFRQVRE